VKCGSNADAIQYVRDRAHGATLPRLTVISTNRLIRLPEINEATKLIAAAEAALQDTNGPVIVVCEPVAWL
jgi:hypothetical protein